MTLVPKPKLQEPDPFDGSDSWKLRTFILQCNWTSKITWICFKTDTAKVNYMLSYLKGSALDCFEPALLDPNEPIWLSILLSSSRNSKPIWNLCSRWQSRSQLEALWMHDSHQATKYSLNSSSLASRVQWGEAALCRQAYNEWPNESRMTWSTTISRIHYLVSENSCKLLMHDTGMTRWSFPQNSSIWIFRKQVRTKTDSNKSDNKFGKGSSDSKPKNTSFGSTRTRATLPNESPPLSICLQTQ